jgi:putative membrane protein
MILIHWLVSVLAILIAATLVPGVTITIWGAVVLAVVLGIINLFLKPLLKILTFPLTILTLGLFSFVLNALLILLADALVVEFAVASFWIALLYSIVLSLINAVFFSLTPKRQ